MTFKDILYYKIWNYVLKNGMVLLGKSDPPPSPDYTGAAKETAAGNLEAARVAAQANRVNQYTPQGSLVYTQTGKDSFDQAGYDNAMKSYNTSLANYHPTNSQTGYNPLGWLNGGSNTPTASTAPTAPTRDQFTTKANPDQWNATTTLSPVEQQKLDQNNNLSLGLLGTAQKGLNGVDEALSKGFDFNALPKAQVDAGQTAQDAIMARLNPQFAQSEEALRTRLVNQGVRPGSQAWDNEFRNFNSGKNDAYSQAALNGIGVGQQARQQALQEQEFGRTEGLNMVNALRTGNQVQNPTFTNVPQQATTAGADILGATNAKYQNQLANVNAQNAASGGLFGGLAGIAGTALGGPLGGAAGKYFFGG